jgi:putative phosphoribosyl transferase
VASRPPPTGPVEIELPDRRRLEGDRSIPEGASGIVLFAHGSGSSRFSPRNRQVAAALNQHGLVTLLFDLLTDDEAGDRAKVFDVELLAERLLAVADWSRTQEDLAPLRAGYFGASTGAAAALIAAAERPEAVHAVVSRGGRPDLAAGRLPAVKAPTLLIVGGADAEVLHLNREALAQLECPAELAVVPDATHLFEEPGTLEQVAELSAGWFERSLRVPA